MWQPIETAPKDGARGLLLAKAGEWVGEGYWSDYDDTWREVNNHGTDAWGHPLDPTHWMHLPEPPLLRPPFRIADQEG